MFQEKNEHMNNSLSLRTNFSNRKPNLVYTKIYSSNAIVFPPLKKLFLGSVLLYTGIQSFRQWRKYNKSMTINNNSTVFWNVNVFIKFNINSNLNHIRTLLIKFYF